MDSFTLFIMIWAIALTVLVGWGIFELFDDDDDNGGTATTGGGGGDEALDIAEPGRLNVTAEVQVELAVVDFVERGVSGGQRAAAHRPGAVTAILRSVTLRIFLGQVGVGLARDFRGYGGCDPGAQ